MSVLIKCELEYRDNTHLQQLYAGFAELRRKGCIRLQVINHTKDTPRSSRHLLSVTVNDHIKVIYDALDGFNWIAGTLEDNLRFFQTQFSAHHYFKRSFNEQLTHFAPPGCKVWPLGLNYHIQPENRLARPSIKHLRELPRRNDLISRLFSLNNDNIALPAKEYEARPVLPNELKFLFLTRIWDPEDSNFDSDRIRTEVETINKTRISVIKTCRREFGDRFCGGLTDDQFSRRHAKALIAPVATTNKRKYLELVKEHAICIATTGLHGSVGWKFAEYVAASRAIVSEPLIYHAPGGFGKNRNYLEFTDDQSLIACINFLLRDRSALMDMMQENYRYYNNYLKPENVVLNSLLRVLEEG